MPTEPIEKLTTEGLKIEQNPVTNDHLNEKQLVDNAVAVELVSSFTYFAFWYYFNAYKKNLILTSIKNCTQIRKIANLLCKH